MAEKRTPVRPVRVAYSCDKCGEEMSATGEMHPTLTPIYIYTCPNGHVFKSRKTYPHITYLETW